MEEKSVAKAVMKYVRVSPRKVKIVCDMIRDMDVKAAKACLKHTPKAACEPMLKLLNSAVANAENNLGLDPENLYVCEVKVDPGPILKRGMPRAQGRMYRINKRTSHISLMVAEIEED